MVLLNSSSCKFGWKPENFEFTSLKGDNNSLYNMSGLNGILIMFICNHCPYVRSIEKKIAIETSRFKKIKNLNCNYLLDVEIDYQMCLGLCLI